MPKVSVIITTYNYGRFLGEAVRSVLDQTFTDFEVIIVDDGSTDNTREVVGSFKDPRIRYIYQENQGVAVASDTGTRAASGEYVFGLGADDILVKDALQKEVQVLDRYPEVAFTYGQTYLMDSGGHVFGLRKQRGEDSYIRKGKEEIRKAILGGNHVPGSTIMARRRYLDEVGFFDATFRSGSEDFDMWVRLARAYDVAYIAEPLVNYRIHDSSISRGRRFTEIERSNGLILERMFNDQELGLLFLPLRTKAYFNMYLRLADYAHGSRDMKTSKEYLIRAAKMQPKWFWKRLWLPFIVRFVRTYIPPKLSDLGRGAKHSLAKAALKYR